MELKSFVIEGSEMSLVPPRDSEHRPAGSRYE